MIWLTRHALVKSWSGSVVFAHPLQTPFSQGTCSLVLFCAQIFYGMKLLHASHCVVQVPVSSMPCLVPCYGWPCYLEVKINIVLSKSGFRTDSLSWRGYGQHCFPLIMVRTCTSPIPVTCRILLPMPRNFLLPSITGRQIVTVSICFGMYQSAYQSTNSRLISE